MYLCIHLSLDEIHVCVCVCRNRFLGNYTSHHHQAWHGVVPKSTECYRDVNLILCFGTVTTSDMRMHHVLIILTLTFNQGNTALILNV